MREGGGGRGGGVGSNYLNIRRRRRALRAGIFHGSVPYYASNLRPAVRTRCFSGNRLDDERERVRAKPSDAEHLYIAPAVASGTKRLRREGCRLCARGTNGSGAAVGAISGVACCARY